MKTILTTLILLTSISSFAAAQKIDCSSNSDSDLQLTIALDQDSRVQGASLYNVDWSQTAESTYQSAVSVGTTNPMEGFTVILKDGQTIDIEWSVLDKGHDGRVMVGNDEYHCY